MDAYRLRVELPDRPGALARVAAVIAASDADVLSVDIHELDGDVAIDEIVVDAPDGWEPGRLRDALARSEAGTLLSSQRTTDTRDAIVTALTWCAAMVAAGPQHCDLELGRAILDVTNASAAWVCDVDEALELPGGAVALERGGPVVVRTDALPSAYGDDVPRSTWVLAAPDGILNATIVAFATRPSSLRFTPTDLARVAMLLALRRELALAPRDAAAV